MFYYLTLSKSIDIEPKFFGPQLRSVIENDVKTKVEGVCLGKLGYCVCVTKLRDVAQGLIRADGTGLATFDVRYDCIVFRPFSDQVLDATVREVLYTGFIAEADNEGAFESVEKEWRITAGTDVRLKILSVRVTPTEIACIATLNEKGLGVPSI